MPTTRKWSDGSISDAGSIGSSDKLVGLQGGVVKRFARSLLDTVYAALAHHARHEDGGADEISVAGLSGLAADPQKLQVLAGGSAVGTRPAVNFIQGTGTALTVADNAGAGRVDVTIASASSPVEGALVYTYGHPSLTQNATVTPDLDNGVYDSGGYLGATLSRITCPTSKNGIYIGAASLRNAVSTPSGTAFRGYEILHKNSGGTILAGGMRCAVDASPEGCCLASVYSLAVTDYIETGCFQNVTASQFLDGGSYLALLKTAAQIGARIETTVSTINLTANTDAVVSFNTTLFDSSSFWSGTNPTRCTIGATGNYFITAGFRYNNGSVGNVRMQLRLNGSTIIGECSAGSRSGTGATQNLPVFFLGKLTAGDYVELVTKSSTTQTSSTAATGQPVAYMSVAKMGALSSLSVSAAQTLSNSTHTAINTDTVGENGGGLYPGSGTDLLVPANGAGWYLIVGQVDWPSGTNTTQRLVELSLDQDLRFFARQWLTCYNAAGALAVVAIARLQVGRAIRLMGWQNSGGNVTTGTRSYLAAAKL
jgi:hypothetical protein